MKLSILVVSKTPELLNTLLASIKDACSLPSREAEILCSFNGETSLESLICNHSGYEFIIAQRDPYHFASNINALANKANGELLLLINDDIILDTYSIDAAMQCLYNTATAGLIGGRLRDHSGCLTHAGIVFDDHHSPYHQLDQLIPANAECVNQGNYIVPAVTGALMLIRRSDFEQIKLSETYRVCGEDVELCLNIRSKLKKEIWYCPAFSGIHEPESTRKQEPSQHGNSEDLSRIRTCHRHFLEQASSDQLLHEWEAGRREVMALRSLLNNQSTFKDLQAKLDALETELNHVQTENHALQIARLRHEQELSRLRPPVQPEPAGT